MVATGPFRSAVMPDIPGMEVFKGEMIHVKDYRQQSIFQGKRVLFVGKDSIMLIEKIPESTHFCTVVYSSCAARKYAISVVFHVQKQRVQFHILFWKTKSSKVIAS